MSKIKMMVMIMLAFKLIQCDMPVEPVEMCVINIETRYAKTKEVYPGMCFAFVVEGNNNILDNKTDKNGKFTIAMKEPVFEGCEYWLIFFTGDRIESTRDKEKRYIEYPINEKIVFEY